MRSRTLAEIRADLGQILMCPTCVTETFPSRKGTCAACDTPLDGAVPDLTPPPEPAEIECLFPDCHETFIPNARGMAREFCSERHRRYYWAKYTEAGRAYREKSQERRAARKKAWREEQRRAA